MKHLRIWNRVGVFIAWGLANGSITRQSLEDLYKYYRWYALEVPQHVQQGETVEDTQVLGLRSWLRMKHGPHFGIWQDTGVDADWLGNVQKHTPNLVILNVETEQAVYWAQQQLLEFRRLHPHLPAALITNFGGLGTKAQCKPFIDQGFVCIPEAYQNANPQATPDAVAFEAIRRGWRPEDVFPCLGIWGGYGIEKYDLTAKSLVHGYSVYLAEGLT